MGGRGQKSASGRGAGLPNGGEGYSESGSVRVMSEDEYLGTLGLSSPVSDYTLDTTRLPHGETARQRAQRLRDSERAMNEYAQRRSAAKAEYARLVERGEIRPPTRIESMVRVANGSDDNDSVQAARRALAKRGYDWRTGRKL